MNEQDAQAFAKKVARLYLSSELSDDEPVEPVEVLDALIIEAREKTGEKPEDVEAWSTQK
jgi:hypothetical protein